MANHRKVSLNLNVRGIGQSATLAINERSRDLRAQGRRVYRLGLGQSPFPVPEPVVDALRRHAAQKDYLSVYGLPALREAVAGFHRRLDGLHVEADHVLIGPGSKELMFLLQLAYYGEIILPTPGWVSYGPQARIIGRNIKYVHTTYESGWRITAEQLEEVLRSENDRYRPRILLLNYPSNPAGSTYAPDELQAIARVARRFDLVVLSDEIYGLLQFDAAHVSIARYYEEGTILSSGLSKWCGAGGWRLGTFTFPASFDWLMRPMAGIASETFTSVSAPIQYAAVTAFSGHPEIERYLVRARRVLAWLGERLAGRLVEAGIRVRPARGAFYLFPDFGPLAERLAGRGIADGATLCDRLLAETGVAVLPGVAFMRPPEELTARIAFVDFDGTAALAALRDDPDELPTEIEFVCRPVIEAVDRMADWAAAGGGSTRRNAP